MAQQGLADENGGRASAADAADVGGGAEAALGHNDSILDSCGQAHGGAQVNGEIVQIAVVDANQISAGGQRALQFRLVVNFHQRGQAGGCGPRAEAAQLGVLQDAHDEEDGVGPALDGLGYLAFVNNKVLAQQRQGDGLADGAQISQRTLEEVLIGQDRQAGGPGGFVFARDADGIEIRAYHPGGGGGLLDFRDEGGGAARGALQGANEIAPRLPRRRAWWPGAGGPATSRFFCATILSRIVINPPRP